MKSSVVIADIAGIAVLSGCAAGGLSNERRVSTSQASASVQCEILSERYGVRMSPAAMYWDVRRYLPAYVTCHGSHGVTSTEYIKTSGGVGDVDFWLADMRVRMKH